MGTRVLSRECVLRIPACRKRRLNGAVFRNKHKRVASCRCLDGHIKEPYEMSMALGARPQVQLPSSVRRTSIWRRIYDKNIVDCDVKHPIHLTSPHLIWYYIIVTPAEFWIQKSRSSDCIKSHPESLIILCSCWFCTPPPYFEAEYCLFCGRRRVAVARYRMICLVLLNNPKRNHSIRPIHSFR